MKITIIGSGYVGLVTGACFAEVGNEVICLDIDAAKIDKLNQAIVPIYEPGLQDIIERNIETGRLKFTTNIQHATEFGDVQFIAVGTPSGEDGSADLNYVIGAAQNIGKYVTRSVIVVNKSTVPVGTCQQVTDVITAELSAREIDHAFSVVSNPEFLKEGAAINDFLRPDRVVIGSTDERAIAIMKELYSSIVRSNDRLIVMKPASAELTKYAANAMLATRISFMNELANLAENVGADIGDIRTGIGSDPRIGYNFLYAGIGYGGSCFPKDVRALKKIGADHGVDLKISAAVEEVNITQKQKLCDKIQLRFGDNLSGLTFAVWGLSFKPETDDMREAPSLVIIPWLLDHGARIQAYDPVAMQEAKKELPNNANLIYQENSTAVLNNADALLILTEWKEFRMPDFDRLKAELKNNVIFDGRNIFNPQAIKEKGIEYYGIGR